jgi:hypothetical protein
METTTEKDINFDNAMRKVQDYKRFKKVAAVHIYTDKGGKVSRVRVEEDL